VAVDLDAAFVSYEKRFAKRFGEKSAGSFVKFGRHMVQKLARSDFDGRLEHYLRMHASCKRMLETGATISDAVVLDFEEAAAWIVIEAPNLLQMFQGEVGDPGIETEA